jgi:futalosine hydrolase
MGLSGADIVREAAWDCRVVLLAATEGEAEPLRAALLKPEKHVVATKTIVTGELETAGAGPAISAVGPTVGAVAGVQATGRPVKVVLAITGCDKANVAHALTCLLQVITPPPRLVLQVGIAGALPAVPPRPSASVGDIVLATRETYSDTGSSSSDGWLSAANLGLPIARVGRTELGGSFPLDTSLVQAAAEIIGAVGWPVRVAPEPPAVLFGPLVTSSQVTGLSSEAEEVARRSGALAESMEGAAAAHICALYGVPFLEIRGISNLVTERDRNSWQVERATAVAARAALAVIAALDQLPLAAAARRAGG